MITLRDAIERAKLAADDTGMLSQQTYNMICSQLSDAEKYAFTLGLVDLGIQTKRASEESERIVRTVLGVSERKFRRSDPWNPEEFVKRT